MQVGDIMQFLSISATTRLQDLSDTVGERNVEDVLSLNGLTRTPNIGAQFYNNVSQIQNDTENVDYQRKSTILNTFVQDSDVFEEAALSSELGWKVLSNLNTFPDRLKIPETLSLPDSVDIIGNGISIGNTVYSQVMEALETPPHTIPPEIFNTYSAITHTTITDKLSGSNSPLQWFNLPWGDITLRSSIGGESWDIPAYPEELSDGVVANYSTMPDLLYQYEPWYVYNSSGPRSNTYEFHLHRDMWTGDHTDGRANELIRFCQAQCYPQFNGSAVNVPIVTLYVKGEVLITGIMTECNVDWAGPIGQDGWYLEFTLSLSITEVASQALNYDVIRQKPLIG